MAKVSFTKLGLTKNTEVKSFNFNEQAIEVKQYLSMKDKTELVGNVLNYTIDTQTNNRFANPMQMELFTLIEVVEKYTNITFTENQKKDPIKLYDYIQGSGLYNLIIENMNPEEFAEIWRFIHQTVNSYYTYNNSIYGILDNIGTDYNGLNLDAKQIIESLNNPENVGLLKDVITKLG